jgi:integrase
MPALALFGYHHHAGRRTYMIRTHVRLTPTPPYLRALARHSACTLMEQAGVPISIVSAWAGHASAEFTYRTYVHASGEDLAAGRDALSRVHGGETW